MLRLLRAAVAWVSRSRKNEREIFSFHDGQQDRRIDPLLVWRKLWNDPDCDLANESKVAADPQIERPGQPPRSMYPAAEVLAAEDKVLALTRRVFGVKPLDEGGLTMRETDELLGRFFRYVETLKKKRRVLPTPTQPLGPKDSASPQMMAPTSLPEKSELDCGCTGTASNVAAPIG